MDAGEEEEDAKTWRSPHPSNVCREAMYIKKFTSGHVHERGIDRAEVANGSINFFSLRGLSNAGVFAHARVISRRRRKIWPSFEFRGSQQTSQAQKIFSRNEPAQFSADGIDDRNPSGIG